MNIGAVVGVSAFIVMALIAVGIMVAVVASVAYVESRRNEEADEN